MLAFVLDRYGGPDAARLREMPVPEPAASEVRIRVHAAGLNPIDFKTREGKTRLITRHRLPVVMGCELAGVVDARGSGASRFAVGDRVFARVDKVRLGAFAQYAAVHQDLVAPMPSSVEFEVAAGLPLAGLTALQALRDELRIEPGQRLFIPGGAGGVGTFAIQLAKLRGAEVITTASARGEALVRRLGADQVVDYTAGRFEDAVGPVDGAFDLIGGDTLSRLFSVVKRGGKVVSIAGVPEPATARIDLQRGPMLAALFWLVSAGVRRRARRRGVSYRLVFMRPDGSDLAELAELVDRRKLEVVVDRVVPFSSIADAFTYLETGRAKGKVVVRMIDP
jgi:NADPH:quinone reductase-like Zn-dependent oxidoreductase